MDLGHFYFLSLHYLDDFPNPKSMGSQLENDMRNHQRPCFCAFTEDNSIYWVIPISSKVDKFEEVYNDKIKRYGKCDTIDFCHILGHKKAVLIQNMIPRNRRICYE